jgi:hemerythrin
VQVSKAVAEMDKVVQQAAANSEESSSAAEELASQSQELASLVGRFQLAGETARGPLIKPAKVVPLPSKPRPKVSSGGTIIRSMQLAERLIPLDDEELLADSKASMPLITWNNSYSIKIPEIDRQHQKLIQIINDLNDAMRQSKGIDVVGKLIRELVSYTETHFRNEEELFERFRYPDTAAHKIEHAKFVQKMVEFEDDYRNGRLGLSIDMMKFLSDWLLKHIKGSDMRYAPYLIERGVR